MQLLATLVGAFIVAATINPRALGRQIALVKKGFITEMRKEDEE